MFYYHKLIEQFLDSSNRESFIKGVTRLVDISPFISPEYAIYHRGLFADSLAIRSDWENVGKGLYSAIERLKEIEKYEA